MKINENLVVEHETVRTTIPITKDNNQFVDLGTLNLTKLEFNKPYRMYVELKCTNLVYGTAGKYIRFQGSGDVTGWNSHTPQRVEVGADKLTEGNVTFKLTNILVRETENPNKSWELSLRINGYKSGYYRVDNFKIEDSDQATLYVPHRSLLTEEQQALMPEHLFGGGCFLEGDSELLGIARWLYVS